MVPSDVLTPENAWRRIGFCRHAHEFWLLAGEEGAGAGSDPILTRYDQTSMRQINDLIADFQKFQIHPGGGGGV